MEVKCALDGHRAAARFLTLLCWLFRVYTIFLLRLALAARRALFALSGSAVRRGALLRRLLLGVEVAQRGVRRARESGVPPLTVRSCSATTDSLPSSSSPLLPPSPSSSSSLWLCVGVPVSLALPTVSRRCFFAAAVASSDAFEGSSSGSAAVRGRRAGSGAHGRRSRQGGANDDDVIGGALGDGAESRCCLRQTAAAVAAAAAAAGSPSSGTGAAQGNRLHLHVRKRCARRIPPSTAFPCCSRLCRHRQRQANG